MYTMDSKLLSVVTLSDVFGKDLILNPRASFSNYGWLPKNVEKLDFLTGAPLTIAGEMPVICSGSVVDEEILSLLKLANLDIAAMRYEYQNEEDYKAILAELKNKERKMVINHPHPPSEISPDGYWINPQIVGFLNNKANLSELVLMDQLPMRIVVKPMEIDEILQEYKQLPIVIKAASDEPNGGGYDVAICYTEEDVYKAVNFFGSCETIVIEKFIDIAKSYNIQFANTVDDKLIYLGTSQQITTPSGVYIGNWIEKNYIPPDSVIAIGQNIMEKARSMGFIGIAGFDIVIDKSGSIFVMDLNFRLNGSTTALLLKDSIFKAKNASVLLFQNWDSHLPWRKFLNICNNAIEELNFIPLAFNKPLPTYDLDAKCYVSGVLFGASKEEILSAEAKLSEMLL